MGNREKLLAGAKECLRERGYTRTKARDVAAASGANLASIGYHFGSMEALLTAAMLEGVEEWGSELGRVLAEAGGSDPETIWTRVVESFAGNRAMLLASFEAFAQADHLPELRAQLAAAHEEARHGLALLFLGEDAAGDEDAVRAAGSVHLALLTGLMSQWLLDPARAPSGREVVEGLCALGLADRAAGA